MYTNEEINLITLSSFDFPYEVKRTLLNDFEVSSPDFEKHGNLLIKTLSRGVYNKVKEDFFNPAYRRQLIEKLDKNGIRCVTYFSENYPKALKNIPDPPVLLYCKGDVGLLNSRCFSVVGSRKSTPRILEDCKKISGQISSEFTVVSGLAEGADSMALKGALDARGKVISVLANGLERIYPACNTQLAKRIEGEGLLITEYPPEEKAKPYYFPVRNRIIAGLSVGTLVVSAGKKSGTLITADYADDYSRDVFAFPHYPGAPAGEGCNFLLKNGAFLVENILDIFGRYGLDFKTTAREPLTKEEQAVYDIIKSNDEAYLFTVAEKLKKPVFEISVIISALEIKGRVSRLGGNRYSVK